MKRPVDPDLLEQLGHDALDDAGDDVADQQDDQEPDQLRDEREERVEALLDRAADVHGGEEHADTSRCGCALKAARAPAPFRRPPGPTRGVTSCRATFPDRCRIRTRSAARVALLTGAIPEAIPARSWWAHSGHADASHHRALQRGAVDPGRARGGP